jgi:replicative DNA helicase
MTISKLFIGLCFWDTEIIYKSSLVPEDFPEPESTIFKAMLDITREGEIPDEGSIHVRTGISFSDLFAYKNVEIASITPNWMFYEKQIKESVKNRLIREQAENIFKSEGLNSDEMVSMMMETIEQVQSESSISSIKSIKQIADETEKYIEEQTKLETKVIGIPTGLNKLDSFIQGFQKSKLYYIGGRPSQGKTALLLNFIASADRPVGVISAESPSKSLMVRMLANKTLVDSRRIDCGKFVEGEYDSIKNSLDYFRSQDIYVEDNSDIKIGMIYSRALEMKRRWNIQALFVDYLQYIKPDNWMMKLKTHEQVAHISMQLKNIARKLEIPVIVASQLKRDAEGKRPVLSDLSDSTQLERDADVVILIYNQQKEEGRTKTFLLVEKNREGTTGVVSVEFLKQYMQFRDSDS